VKYHLRQQSAWEAKQYDIDRTRKIRAGRIEKNEKEFRKYRLLGYIRAWEFVQGMRMPEPDFELEPSLFLEWLMLDTNEVYSGTRLQYATTQRVAQEERRQRRVALASRQLYAARAARRRQARLLLACVAWADRTLIREIYRKCRQMNLEHGKNSYHVDHIIPLQGRFVSGLHVEGNLRIVSRTTNLLKRNCFDQACI
jgi:hypothetical protein